MDEVQASVFYMIEPHFSDLIETMFQQLLNTKHLYQKVSVVLPDANDLLSSVSQKLTESFGAINNSTRALFEQAYSYALGAEWSVRNPDERHPGFYGASKGVSIEPSISIIASSIRSYCHTCGNEEPYNFVQGNDVLREFPYNHPTKQVFALAFRCQGCKGVPEVFLVRRDDNKLSLCGRSPIEQVVVASQLPKPQNKYISDATVAFNSGQILAGIFLLRVFIEQYVRSKSSTPNTDQMETLFGEYANTLPVNFRNSFPSLKSIYDDLSVAIHAADPSDQIYLKAKERIEHHFEGKRAFRIT